MPGVDKDLFESKVWAKFESQAAPVIAKVVRQGDFSEEDLDMLLNFVAMVAVRAPRLQNAGLALVEQRSGLPFAPAVRQPESWDVILRWSAQAEMGWGPDELRRLLDSPGCEAAHPQVWRFFNTVMTLDTLLKVLAERKWVLYSAADEGLEFICSDNPMGIVHAPPVTPYRPRLPTEKGTVVSFPLHRRVALVGRFDGDDAVADADRRIIALVNFSTLIDAWRFLYAPHDDFVCLREGDYLGNAAYVFEHLCPQRTESQGRT